MTKITFFPQPKPLVRKYRILSSWELPNYKEYHECRIKILHLSWGIFIPTTMADLLCVNCGKWCVPLIEREIWNLLAFLEPQSSFIFLLLLILMIMIIVLSHLWSSGNMRIYRLQWTSLPLNDQTPSHHLSCLSILHRDHKTQSTSSWSSLSHWKLINTIFWGRSRSSWSPYCHLI